MKRILVLFCVAITVNATAQISRGGQPINWQEKDINRFEVSFENFDELDLDQIQSEDEVTDAFKETPYRFGIEREVNYSPNNSGAWETLEDGTKVWRLGIYCPNATSISFHLDAYKLEKGASLFIWNEDRTEFLGSFNHLTNKTHGELPISLLYSEKAIIEYIVPEGVGEGELSISQIVHGYRGIVNKFDPERGPYGNSGACNINVNCPEGDDWQTEKKSVALIIGGGFAVCSGALVNNTANDGTPYFLTANHCLGNPANWTYLFNHETEGCTGNNGPIDDTVASGDLRASNGGSDFALVELSSTPPESYNVQYSGWDKTDSESAVTAAVGIHHPAGDLKKICLEEDAPYHANQGGAAVWYIDEWEDGVTEGGSSGSPLYDQNHRIIGQLYGGFAACSGTVNNGQADWYGRFGVSWDGNNASSRLRDWLDPLGLDPSTIDGYPEGAVSYENDASITLNTSINGVVCGDGLYSGITIRNNGLQPLTAATVYVTMNGSVTQTINWTGNLMFQEEDTFGLNYQTAVDGMNALSVEIESANNDENDGNNVSSADFQAVTTPIFFTLEIVLDQYGSETTWNVKDSSNEDVITGGPYQDDLDQTLVTEEFCLSEACYTFTIEDQFGDGICCGFGDGSYELKNQNNVTLAAGGEFTNSESEDFCASFTSISDVKTEEIRVYPNPTNSEISFNSTETINSIEIYDVSGRLVESITLNINGNIEFI